MSKCVRCRKAWDEVDGCAEVRDPLRFEEFTETESPVRVGDEPVGTVIDEECPACSAKVGKFHHPGCDWEICPICGDQYIFCECVTVEKEMIQIARERGFDE
jgi:hypothetical protein